MEQCFIINGRFLVDPATNVLTDREDNSTIRLEDRLMQILCILTKAPGRTVLREEIVEEIWQNYGGGDEGLTQTISALRKALKDKDKLIIQTVPKKGYLFTGTINNIVRQETQKKTNNSKVFFITGIAAVILLLFLIVTSLADKFKEPAAAPSNVVYNDLGNFKADTVSCTDSNHNSYKWVQNGDAQPEFFINNTQVPIGKWESHMAVINHLKYLLKKERGQ